MEQLTQSEKIAIIVSIVVILVFFFIFANPFARRVGPESLNFPIEEEISINENTMSGNEAEALEVEILQGGTGEVAEPGDLVTVNYVGRFEDGTVFDSSLTEGREPFQFILGAGMVIPGWDRGVAGMRVGERRRLTIQPELGYGPNDYGPIPGGSVLVFDVELLEVGDLEAAPSE